MNDRHDLTAPAAAARGTESLIESPYAWARLAAAVALSTIGGVGMWSIVVAMPAVQAEFGVARAGASLPYSLAMIGFMFGSVAMGRFADRFGILRPVIFGTIMLSVGYVGTAWAPNYVLFTAIFALFIGMLGSAATFTPLVADCSLWFDKRRGIAIAIAASGNYLAGTVWPPILEHFISTVGWRQTHLYVAIVCLLTMFPLMLMLRRPPPVQPALASAHMTNGAHRPLGLAPNFVLSLLIVAAICCCVAMSMPQVHIVAYCVDLGYGPARGAEMLAIMLGLGIVSRLASGWILDKIGGLPTLLVGSTLQAAALAFYIPFDGLISLYLISAMFGLVQGGIVPSYAFIVRELFPAQGSNVRVSLVLSAALAGMALGGWLTGLIFDATGSYQTALVNGIGWNIVNMAIVTWLLLRQGGRAAALKAA